MYSTTGPSAYDFERVDGAQLATDLPYFETDMCSCVWVKDSDKMGGGEYGEYCVPRADRGGGDCRLCDSSLDAVSDKGRGGGGGSPCLSPALRLSLTARPFFCLQDHCPMCLDDGEFNDDDYSFFFQFNNISAGYRCANPPLVPLLPVALVPGGPDAAEPKTP